MAARCASCSYPLSVSDSVSCCECFSYFHIDCAQLVGFPYYELSSDPLRNTFQCQTCKILPLPQQSDSFSDSDSEEFTMPSRQLDYHLDGQPDFAKDMNEIKGTVQDLSELCKDMFREISELKSINLTLRCGVENLRHDNDQQNGVIADLKRRIEALEGGRAAQLFKPIDRSEMYVDRLSIDKEEDAERFSTPDPECSKSKDIESIQNLISQNIYETQHLLKSNLEYGNVKEFDKSKIITTEQLDQSGSFKEEEDIDSDKLGISNEDVYSVNKEGEHFAHEETISKSEDESNDPDLVNPVQDWEWKGNKAIHLREEENESFEDNEESETSDDDVTVEQGWEILEDDLKSVVISEAYVKEVADHHATDKESEVEAEEKRLSWADDVEDYDEEEKCKEPQEDIEETFQSSTTYTTDNFRGQRKSEFEVEEAEEKAQETVEEVTDNADRTSLKSIKSISEEEGVEKSKIEEDIKIVESDAEIEGRVSCEGSRLEGAPATEEGVGPEGESREGGQSPEQGEVQPSEFSESSEPPPPQPQHTPDDLWDYLKESVSGEHPATVEEFVQKLIGTLEHVPEEYLKPVIDYNIKRAISPSVTDGENLDTKEGGLQEGESQGTEATNTGETEAQGGGEVAPEGEDQLSSLQEPPVADRDGFNSKDSPASYEDTTNIPEELSEPNEGYSALEATD